MQLTSREVFSESPVRAFVRHVTEDVSLFRDASGRACATLEHEHVVHSPTGFEWGYAGSGPADLALNILVQHVNPAEAWRLHQLFKRDVLAVLSEKGPHIIRAADVIVWIERQWAIDAIVGRETARV